MSVIAVVSGIYCSSEEIIQRVADRLGYSVVGDELLERAAREHDTTVEKLARALTGARALFNAITREWEKSLIYVKAALAGMLQTDDQIFVGPATHLIADDISHVLRVALVADHDYRLVQAREQDDLDADEAWRRIRKSDEELAQWTRQVRNTSPWDPTLYDIKLPLPSTSPGEAVEIICSNITKPALRPTDASIQAVLDFQLATRINLELLEKKLHSCDVQVTEGTVSVVIHQRATQPGKPGSSKQALRYENVEQEVREALAGTEGVDRVEVRPGIGWYGRPSRTLLVDDEREYVVTLSERLEMRDIESDVVHDGQGALTYVQTDVPDVMVLDLRMPGMDGLEVLRRIKKDHPGVEVIIVTGHGSDNDEKLARELGAFDYMKKPVDINVLAETIKAASSRAQARAEEAPSGVGEDSSDS
jgi:CheY-like chemotaxis protein